MNKRTALGLVAICALGAIAVASRYSTEQADPAALAVPPSSAAGSAALADARREAAALIGARRQHQRSDQDGIDLGDKILSGDFAAAAKTLKDVQARSAIQDGEFLPYMKLVRDIPYNDDVWKKLDQWIAQDKSSAEAHMLRAQFHRYAARDARGANFMEHVQSANRERFEKHSREGVADATAALQLDSTNPYTGLVLVNLLKVAGDSPEMDAAFTRVVGQFPDYTHVYEERLLTLQPQWGGSIDKMYAFVDLHASGKPADSSQRWLYAELYGFLANNASGACRGYPRENRDSCIDAVLQKIVKPELMDAVHGQIKLHGRIDARVYRQRVSDFLDDLISSGADHAATAFLQLTASAMGVNNERVPPAGSKRSYMIDQLTARRNYRAWQYDDAEAMYQQAIADVESETTLTVEEQNDALVSLYDELASTYLYARQYPLVLVYGTAADLLGGPDRGEAGTRMCSALAEMRLYPEAIADCTMRIASTGSMDARLARGESYYKTGDFDSALKDLRVVAASESSYRSSAGIWISGVFLSKNDLKGALEALNSYPFLYDPQTSTREQVALAYNNRCYTKMNLKMLEEALADCTESLKHKPTPDALSKQQQLVKMLGQKGQGAKPASAPPPENKT